MMKWRSMSAGNSEGGETVDIAVPAPGEYGDQYFHFDAPYPQGTATLPIGGRSMAVRVKSTSPYFSDMWIGAEATTGNQSPAGNAEFYNAYTGQHMTSHGALGGIIGIGFSCNVIKEIPAGERLDIPADMWVAFSKVAELIMPQDLESDGYIYHFRMPPDLENLQLRQIHTGGRAQYRHPGWATTGGLGGGVVPEPELIAQKMSWSQWAEWNGVFLCPTYNTGNLGYSTYIKQFYPPDSRQDPALYNPYVGDGYQGYPMVINTLIGSGPFTFTYYDNGNPRLVNPTDPTTAGRTIECKLFGGWKRGDKDIDCVMWNPYCWSKGVSNRKLLFINQEKRWARCGLIASYPSGLSDTLRRAWGWMDQWIVDWGNMWQIPYNVAWFDYDPETEGLIPHLELVD